MSFGAEAAERIAGKTVFLTGASSGIGKATAYELASVSGGNIKLILAARRLDKLEEIKKDIEARYPGVKVLPFKLDVAKHAEIPKIISSIPKEWENVDILINNAYVIQVIIVYFFQRI